MGRRSRPEGRVRRLHAEGDPRAALGDPGHARRPGQRTRPARAGRAAHRHRRPARGRQGVRRGVRDGVPLRPGREVRDRALDAGAGRDRHRLGVPVPGPGPRSGHAHAGREPVRGDDRHARGGSARVAAGLEGDRGDEHDRLVARPRGRRRDVHARRPGDLRGGDEDVRDADGGAASGRALPRADPRRDVPGRDRRHREPDARAPGPGPPHARRCRSRSSGSPKRSARPATSCSSDATPATRPRSRAH